MSPHVRAAAAAAAACPATAPELQLHWKYFEDGDARALAARWWEHGVAVPSEEDADGAAALARELASVGEEGQDQRAEALGATRRLVVRRLQRELRARQSDLASARGEDATGLMHEIQEIARALQKLST